MRILVLFLVTIPVISLGQICNVDFEDNDLTGWYQNILWHWEISNNNPINGIYSLHHAYDNNLAGTDWIAFFHQPVDFSKSLTTWEFSIRYDHDPSASNNWAVFLSSSDLPYKEDNIENALIFGVNYRGSDDKLSLWRQNYGNVECIYSSDFNWEQKVHPGKIVSFRITRSDTGNYSISADTTGSAFFLIGEISESQICQSDCFILYYKYTATYDRGLSFDNFKITGMIEKDTIPLVVTSVNVISPQKIEVNFNKIVQLLGQNEFCIEGAGCGISGTRTGRNFLITMPYNLKPGNHYTLQLPSFSDMMGNPILSDKQNITFYYPDVYDIVITEIMADPMPAVLLPAVEYIELYNRSADIISLKNWHLAINNYLIILPEFHLGANQYALICEKDSAYKFMSENNHIIGAEDFPAINNESCEIILSDPSNRLIHSVDYTSDWFESANKKDGGWSVEMINYNNPCINSGNWGESVDPKGGTPGYPNSISNNIIDIEHPILYRAAITDSGSLMIYFSQPMDSITLVGPDFYIVDHDLGQPSKIIPSWPVADKAELFFNKGFEPLVTYEISLTFDVTDCIGNTFSELQKVDFTKSMQADSAEMLINEIMFNPAPNNFEYIELYNNSDKTIDLRNWKISIGDKSATKKTITCEYFPIPKDNYVIMIKNMSGLPSGYKNKIGDKIVTMTDFPQLSNGGTVIYLYDNSNKMIDAAIYSPSDHNLLIQNSQGVSLERISSNSSGLDPENWQSASSDAGYMTPAAINSQHIFPDLENSLNIEPSTITPGGDGVDDELMISYKLAGSGYMGRILVFNASGNLIYTLLDGGLLGTEGKFIFDGKNKNGNILETGYYILFFDAYKQGNKRFTVKKPFVVASWK